MLRLFVNSKCLAEKKYVLDVIFNQFLGLKYEVIIDENLNNIKCIVPNGKKIIFESVFFEKSHSFWLDKCTLPNNGISYLKLRDLPIKFHINHEEIPVIYGNPNLDFNDDSVFSEIDLFGSIFFMLSRYEEKVLGNNDERNRFSSKQSISFRNGFLLRPIVNEYLELLWGILSFLDNSISRKNRSFTFTLTCDVDWPFRPTNTSVLSLVKESIKCVIREKDISKLLDIWWERFNTTFFGWKFDSHNTFDFLMSNAESINSKMVFYFICDHSGGKIDGNYNLGMKKIQKLIKEIHERGHEIGLHGSYNTFLDKVQMSKEFNILKRTLKELNITQTEFGARQHFLRYQTDRTNLIMDEIGISYDSTLSYADHAGFRTGTCYDYSMYSFEKREMISLKERPLIAMEASVIFPYYMNLGYSNQALDVFLNLKKECQFYSGNFILLWHNSHFHTHKDREMLINICQK